MLLLANVPSQSEIESRLSRLKEGKLMTADVSLFFHLILFVSVQDRIIKRVLVEFIGI